MSTENEGYPQEDPEGFFPHPELAPPPPPHKLKGMSHPAEGKYELLCECGYVSSGFNAFRAIDHHAEHVGRVVTATAANGPRPWSPRQHAATCRCNHCIGAPAGLPSEPVVYAE